VIIVKDNFFSDLDEIKKILQKVPVYSNEDWERSTNKKIYWQGNRSNDFGTSHKDIYDMIKKNIEVTFKKKFKINSMCLHERKDERMNPHLDTDGHDTNCLIYISGVQGIQNGTGFYNNDELSVSVGFMENRAILFPSNHLHSCLQAIYSKKSSFRVTVNCFMEEEK
jgi:hypothetical protein|tara:strand:- start:447 stop:947 length:501 start_codon:yes stop_codon:yes gene_type:complete